MSGIDQSKIRNFCIIAHIDHGKSTLADRIIQKTGLLTEREMQDQVLDNMDLERERGITIKAQAVRTVYKAADGEEYILNMIDTPGHVDFNYEVSRSLAACDGALLVVDASQGIEAQTLANVYLALDHDLDVFPVINKVDLPSAEPDRVIAEIEDVIGLEAQDAPRISAKTGLNVDEVLEQIVQKIPAPEGDPEAPTQVLISTIDYNEYVGRIGVGKVDNGFVKVNQDCVIVNHHDPSMKRRVKISKLYEFDGLNKVEVQRADIGSIVAISGISDIHIGDTICSPENPVAIPFQKISEPTIAMNFMVNDSPLAGQEGKFVTSRHLRERLFRELNTDVSLRVEETENMDSFKVSGRGELHLSVLVENMRREGYEFAVSKAEVLTKRDERNRLLEPMELVYIDVPEEFSGTVIQKLSSRKGELHGMGTTQGGYTRLEFSIPSRGLIGFRGEFMTDTKGNGIINTIFDGYEEYKGDIQYRKQGSIIAFEDGESITYGLYNAQERGVLFIGPGEKVYSGMVVGQTGKAEDVEVNVCKTKHLSNTRSSGSDDALRLVPKKVMSLEQCMDFIDTDELLEVTPKNLRIRKKILDPTLRKRAALRKQQ
mgnify:CR=1 FL=1